MHFLGFVRQLLTVLGAVLERRRGSAETVSVDALVSGEPQSRGRNGGLRTLGEPGSGTGPAEDGFDRET